MDYNAFAISPCLTCIFQRDPMAGVYLPEVLYFFQYEMDSSRQF